jgi:hypothetical protein
MPRPTSGRGPGSAPRIATKITNIRRVPQLENPMACSEKIRHRLRLIVTFQRVSPFVPFVPVHGRT